MAIGTGIVLLVLGLIFATDVIQTDIKYIDESALGTILIVAGVLCIAISLIVNAQRQRRHTTVDRDVVVEERRLR